MFEQITGKDKVDGLVLKERELIDSADVRFNAFVKMFGEVGPLILRDTPARADVVNEVPVAGAELEHAVFAGDLRLQIVLHQRPP